MIYIFIRYYLLKWIAKIGFFLFIKKYFSEKKVVLVIISSERQVDDLLCFKEIFRKEPGNSLNIRMFGRKAEISSSKSPPFR